MNNENNGKLILLDLGFTKFSFNRRQVVNSDNAQISLSVKYDRKIDDDKEVKVTIETALKGDNDSYDLSLTTVGTFKIDFPNSSKEFIEIIMQRNTVAIMFPYIRSQITLLTSQPGFKPIVLQPINVNELIENEKLNQQKE